MAIARAPLPAFEFWTGRDTKRQFRPVRLIIEVEATVHGGTQNPMVGMLIRNRLGMEVFGTNTRIEGIDLGEFAKGDSVKVRFSFRVPSHDRNTRSPSLRNTRWAEPGLAGRRTALHGSR